MIIAASLLLIASLAVIFTLRAIDHIRERRRQRCIRRIAAFIASPTEFDVERLLRIGAGVSLQTIAESVAYTAEHIHSATLPRLVMVVKFYGIDFYLIKKCRSKEEHQAKLLLSKIPLSRDAQLIVANPELSMQQPS